MKILAVIIITVILGYALHLFMPFYAIALAGFAATLFIRHTSSTIALGCFVAGLLLWGSYAFYLSSSNAHLLAARVGTLMGGFSGQILILITALIGGILAGMGGISGWAVSRIFAPANTDMK